MGSSRRAWVRRLAALVLLGAASIPLLPSESPACSRIGPDLLELRGPEAAQDGEAPGAVAVQSVTVRRGNGGETGCTGTSSTSCDDLGSIVVEFEPATDPDSPVDEVGYLFAVVDGSAPSGAFHAEAPPFRPLAGEDPGSLSMSWIDGATDDQEPLRFSITMQAIDADGHLGPVSEPFEITDPGS